MFHRLSTSIQSVYSRLMSTSFAVPELSRLQVTPVPCLKDNYAYILRDVSSGATAIVDGVEPKNVLATLKKLDIRQEDVKFIQTTHRHWDHEGGNTEQARQLGVQVIIGPEPGNFAYEHKVVRDGDVIDFGNAVIKVLHTPCHTTGHVCYYVSFEGEGVVFTGDTLFLGGCGRFFEGTQKEMFSSFSKLKQLSVDTHVYSGHEYTASNLAFAASVEPSDKNIEARLSWAKSATNTHPSTIGEELRTNVFFRSTSEQQLGDYRRAKDNY